jgi:hypothetical protein
MRCKVCGGQHASDAKFCAHCGSRVSTAWRFGWFEAAWIAGLAAVICLSISPYFGSSPYIVGKWSGTPAVMPAGLEQTAGRFARLDITGADAAGNISGTLSVDGLAGPVVGKLRGHHVSLLISSSQLTGPAYYGMGFEGTLSGGAIEGTLSEIGTSQWDRPPLNYELSLTPDQD